jgi:hypothetical protein
VTRIPAFSRPGAAYAGSSDALHCLYHRYEAGFMEHLEIDNANVR